MARSEWASTAALAVAWLTILGFSITEAKYNPLDEGSLPEFTSAIRNLSVPVGRDAVFTCHVKALGSFKVGWVKADSKAIQAIHNTVITHNPRVEVSGDLATTFNLHIASVMEEDRGQYMCQINTDPMTYQVATLDVMVPPEIVHSSSDLELKQGSTATLECRADGYPKPEVSWMRERKRPIKAFDDRGAIRKYDRFRGPVLTVPRTTPEDMGAYFCIAKNDVPPTRSKRIFLYVQYPPKIKTSDQLLAYKYGDDVVLSCTVRAWPKPIVIWNNTGGIIFANDRYSLTTDQPEADVTRSTLTVLRATQAEQGQFACVATNSIGSAMSGVRIHMPITPPPPPSTSSASSSSSPSVSSTMSYSPYLNSQEDNTKFVGHQEEEKRQRRRRKKKNNRRKKEEQNDAYYATASGEIGLWRVASRSVNAFPFAAAFLVFGAR